MRTQLYSIFDKAAGIYTKPLFARADGEVMREFTNLCTSADHPYSDHPEDYSLFRLGIFDDQTGKLTDEANECLANGHEVVALSRQVNKEAQEELLNQVSPGGTA